MAERPVRIQLRRTKGWRMPANTVKVDRSSRFGNHYRVGERYFNGKGYAKINDAALAVDLFRRRDLRGVADVGALRGKNLACWCRLCEAHKNGKPFDDDCPDCAPCHADILGEAVNRPIAGVPA